MTRLPLVRGATGAEVARACPADTAVGPDPLLTTRADACSRGATC